MQISTRNFYDRSGTALSTLSAKADALNTQISSQQRLQKPSDDATAYRQLQGLARENVDAKAYDANLSLAGSILQQADTALSQVSTQVQHASELALQAGNGTLTAANRVVIGDQLASIVETLAGIANSRDVRGQPLFGGSGTGEAATKQTNGSYVLDGGTASSIPVADGQSVQTSESAARVFQVGNSDALTIIAKLAATLQSGAASGTAAATAALTDLTAAGTQVTAVQGSLGARAARVELMAGDVDEAATNRAASRAAIDGFDYATSITELQQTMTILSATQASFSKLSQLSLFDYLR